MQFTSTNCLPNIHSTMALWPYIAATCSAFLPSRSQFLKWLPQFLAQCRSKAKFPLAQAHRSIVRSLYNLWQKFVCVLLYSTRSSTFSPNGQPVMPLWWYPFLANYLSQLLKLRNIKWFASSLLSHNYKGEFRLKHKVETNNKWSTYSHNTFHGKLYKVQKTKPVIWRYHSFNTQFSNWTRH